MVGPHANSREEISIPVHSMPGGEMKCYCGREKNNVIVSIPNILTGLLIQL